MDMKWIEEFTLRVRIEYGTAIIVANKGGLLSLASHL